MSHNKCHQSDLGKRLNIRGCTLKHLLSLAIFIFTSSLLAESLITREEGLKVLYTLPDGAGDSIIIKKELNIGHGVKTHYSFSGTSKGNGSVTIFGTTIKLLDIHDDSIIIKDEILYSLVKDINDDGYKDILIWGVAIYSGEKEWDPKEERPVVALLIFDKNKKKYIIKHKSPEIDIWD